MRITSVNIGKPEALAGKPMPTGIFKHTVDGPVAVRCDGIAGDAVLDRKHHGGLDQAVYLYGEPDYAWWSSELGEALAPGTFGENLTISDLDSTTVAVGERFEIGDVVLEVTSPRLPCLTLARRMGDPKFVKRFFRANRSGAYVRVLREGTVRVGDAVRMLPFEGPRVLLTELMFGVVPPELDRAGLARIAATPIHWKLRRDLEVRLAQIP